MEIAGDGDDDSEEKDLGEPVRRPTIIRPAVAPVRPETKMASVAVIPDKSVSLKNLLPRSAAPAQLAAGGAVVVPFDPLDPHAPRKKRRRRRHKDHGSPIVAKQATSSTTQIPHTPQQQKTASAPIIQQSAKQAAITESKPTQIIAPDQPVKFD